MQNHQETYVQQATVTAHETVQTALNLKTFLPTILEIPSSKSRKKQTG